MLIDYIIFNLNSYVFPNNFIKKKKATVTAVIKKL